MDMNEVVSQALDQILDSIDDEYLGEDIDLQGDSYLIEKVKIASQHPQILLEDPEIKALIEKKFLGTLGYALNVVHMMNEESDS